jgi:hypothetical protein
MGNKKRKERLTIQELGERVKQFQKGKELNPDGLNAFNKALKKAATIKQRGSK